MPKRFESAPRTPNKTRPETRNRFAPHDLKPAEIIDNIVESSEYLDNREKGYSVYRALARSALELAGMDSKTNFEDDYSPEELDNTPEANLNTLFGTMPSFVYGLEAIRHHHEESRLPSREYRSHKSRATKFNHAVKNLISGDPGLRFNNAVDTVSILYGVTNSHRWEGDSDGWQKEQKWFREQIEQRMRGMQQEVLAAQLIESINEVYPSDGEQPRVSVESDVSVEEDLRGTDLMVTLDGVTFPIDIKASERTVQNTRRKSSHPMAVMTTGISSKDLGGNFRVSAKRARRHAPDMLAKLQAAREEFLNSNDARSNSKFSVQAA